MIQDQTHPTANVWAGRKPKKVVVCSKLQPGIAIPKEKYHNKQNQQKLFFLYTDREEEEEEEEEEEDKTTKRSDVHVQ